MAQVSQGPQLTMVGVGELRLPSGFINNAALRQGGSYGTTVSWNGMAFRE